MEAPYPLKVVRSWRIQEGYPQGKTMWFDPSYEVPLLGVLPPEQREDGAGAAEVQMRMELSAEREVDTCEGGDAKMSDGRSKGPGDPPQAFLDSIWEGSCLDDPDEDLTTRGRTLED